MDVLVVLPKELGIAVVYLLEEPGDLVQELRESCRISDVSERVVERNHVCVKPSWTLVLCQEVHLLKQTHHLAVQITGPVQQRRR